MKKIYLLSLLLCLGASGAWAQSFTTGYAAYVVFTDGHDSSPVGETEAACEENRVNVINDYLARHPLVSVDHSRSLPCCPRANQLPEVDIKAWLQLDIPPVCLSCPLLSPDTFEIYYPDFIGQIKDLYYGFKINQYNKELLLLQQKYDLKGFEAEVFKLNNELNQHQQ